MLSWLAHINPGRLGRSVGHDDQAQCAHSSSPSCRQLLTAFLKKSVENYLPSHCTGEETEARGNGVFLHFSIIMVTDCIW